MAGWLLSVFSAVMIVSLTSLLLPEGRLSKFVKPFVSLVIMFVVLSPIVNIGEFISGDAFENGTYIETDKDVLSRIASAKIEYYSENCVKIAEKNGIKNCTVQIEYNVNENMMPTVKGVSVNLKNAVISSDNEHIVILQRLKKEISEYLSIEESGVKINE